MAALCLRVRKGPATPAAEAAEAAEAADAKMSDPEADAARVEVLRGQAEDADHEAFGAFDDGAGDGAVPADGGAELALEPALELVEVGDGEGLDAKGCRVVVAARAGRHHLGRDRGLEGLADAGVAGEAERPARAGSDDVLAVEWLEEDDGVPGPVDGWYCDEAVASMDI